MKVTFAINCSLGIKRKDANELDKKAFFTIIIVLKILLP